ncbi:MAG: hypothetical protein P1V20_05635 [Verrucomicrobiales bacterium]|nr:hypothetical protein [Verrucomicrobiales bacterium]
MRLFSWICLLASFPVFVFAQDGLSETQITKIREQLKILREQNLTGNISKNSSAAQSFRNAASSPKAALELYLKCVKEVDFSRLGKSDSDFREWVEPRKDLHDFKPFLTALQLQLEYLSLSTRSAHAEDLSKIFPDLTTFLKNMASLDAPPHPILDRNVSTTVFADVYGIDEQLNRSGEQWEPNPMKIGSIYDKTILPYLREARPEALDSAWQNRIATEGNMAKLYYTFEDEMDRFAERIDDRRLKEEMKRFVRNKALEGAQFTTRDLPLLMWKQLVDRFTYGNKALAAKAMLDHIQKHIAHDDAMEWMNSLDEMVSNDAAANPADK